MKKARLLCGECSCGSCGFSLVELLVAVALLAVLISVAAPSFANIMRRYRVNTVTEELMASIQWARVEAMRLGQDVVIRRNTQCGVTLANTADWRCGWQLFADLNNNSLMDGAEVALQAVDLPQGVHLNKAGGGSPQFVRISRFGRAVAFGQRFEVFPEDTTVDAGQLVCFSTATRTRAVRGATRCPDVP